MDKQITDIIFYLNKHETNLALPSAQVVLGTGNFIRLSVPNYYSLGINCYLFYPNDRFDPPIL